jgi:hypothetical protein
VAPDRGLAARVDSTVAGPVVSLGPLRRSPVPTAAGVLPMCVKAEAVSPIASSSPRVAAEARSRTTTQWAVREAPPQAALGPASMLDAEAEGGRRMLAGRRVLARDWSVSPGPQESEASVAMARRGWAVQAEAVVVVATTAVAVVVAAAAAWGQALAAVDRPTQSRRPAGSSCRGAIIPATARWCLVGTKPAVVAGSMESSGRSQSCRTALAMSWRSGSIRGAEAEWSSRARSA